jgi:hypothetical protein
MVPRQKLNLNKETFSLYFISKKNIMNIEKLNELRNKIESDFKIKNQEDAINEISELVLKQKLKLKEFKEQEDSDRIFHIWFEGNKHVLCSFLALLLYLPITILFLFSYLLKFVFKKIKIYNLIIYPFAKILELLFVIQIKLFLFNLENFLISQKLKNEYKLRLVEAVNYYLWDAYYK